MQLLILQVLSLISLICGAALLPPRQANITSIVESICGLPLTVTATTTVTVPPSYITVAVPDSSSISSSLSQWASMDSEEVSWSSELAPVSGPHPTLTHTFTHSVVVPAYSAAETSDDSSVYFISIGPNTTVWNYTPTPSQEITVGVTYITVSPLPSSPPTSGNTTHANGTVYTTVTTHITRTTTTTIHSGFTSDPNGWNHTSGYPTFGATAGTGVASGTAGTRGWGTAGTAPALSYGASVNTVSTISKTTLNPTTVSSYSIPSLSGYPTLPPPPSYGPLSLLPLPSSSRLPSYGPLSLPPLPSSVSPYSYTSGFEKRQICTMISATFLNGEIASWCNNWDGSTVNQQTTYTATSYAGSAAHSTSSQSAQSPVSQSATLTSPVVPSSTMTSSTSLASNSCGLSGDYFIDFDDLPVFAAPDNTSQYPPLDQYNPCDNFYWGSGWSFVPPPTQPYVAQSGTHLAFYDPKLDDGTTEDVVPVDCAFGAGLHRSDNNYWFNARSAYIRCNNTDQPCDFVATGYQWDEYDRREIVAVTQHYPSSPCQSASNCTLQQISFDDQFTALSSLAFYANEGGSLQPYYVDTIALTWWNDTCPAGLARANTSGCPGKVNGRPGKRTIRKS